MWPNATVVITMPVSGREASVMMGTWRCHTAVALTTLSGPVGAHLFSVPSSFEFGQRRQLLRQQLSLERPGKPKFLMTRHESWHFVFRNETRGCAHIAVSTPVLAPRTYLVTTTESTRFLSSATVTCNTALNNT